MAAAETREGISYQPEIGLTHDAADELIPPPTRGLRPDPVSVPHTNAVFYDLEATGLCNPFSICLAYEPRSEKTSLQGFRQSSMQADLYGLRKRLKA